MVSTITQHLLLAGAKQALMAAIGVIIRQIAQIGQQLVLHGLLLIHMGRVFFKYYPCSIENYLENFDCLIISDYGAELFKNY